MGNYFFTITLLEEEGQEQASGFVQGETFSEAMEKVIKDFGEANTVKVILEYVNDCNVLTVEEIKDYLTDRDFS